MDTLIYVLLMPAVCFAFVCVVLYFIIKHAVRNGVKEAYRELLPPENPPTKEE